MCCLFHSHKTKVVSLSLSLKFSFLTVTNYQAVLKEAETQIRREFVILPLFHVKYTIEESIPRKKKNKPMCSINKSYYEMMSKPPEKHSSSANRTHSEAERRRRKRINGHLSTLRSLLPKTIKPDKATLLAEVVRSIREMKEIFSENTENVPSETDELNLCYCGIKNKSLIKAVISCDERPELMRELAGAVKSAEGRVVRAEMATVGDRTKNVLWVELVGGGGGELEVLRRGLRAVSGAQKVLLSLPVPKVTCLSHRR